MRSIVIVLAALAGVALGASRVRRQSAGTACPDAFVDGCRSCVCSPTTARYTRTPQGLINTGIVTPANVFGQQPTNNANCDRCCYREAIATPQCPIDPGTNQTRQALMAASDAGSLQTIGVSSTAYYVGCCPFTPCQTGYACMFDGANAKYLCCSTGGAVVQPTFPTPIQTLPTIPPSSDCPGGIPSAGPCDQNGQCGGGSLVCQTALSGSRICCPGAATPAPPTAAPAPTDPWGCPAGTNALIYRTPTSAVFPQVPVVGCLEQGGIGCPSPTTCVPHNRPVTAEWKAGICCVPLGVDQSTIPILTQQ